MEEEIFHMWASVYLSSVVDNIVGCRNSTAHRLAGKVKLSKKYFALLAKSRACDSHCWGMTVLKKTKTLWSVWMSVLSLVSLHWSTYITHQADIPIFHQVHGDELPSSS